MTEEYGRRPGSEFGSREGFGGRRPGSEYGSGGGFGGGSEYVRPPPHLVSVEYERRPGSEYERPPSPPPPPHLVSEEYGSGFEGGRVRPPPPPVRSEYEYDTPPSYGGESEYGRPTGGYSQGEEEFERPPSYERCRDDEYGGEEEKSYERKKYVSLLPCLDTYLLIFSWFG